MLLQILHLSPALSQLMDGQRRTQTSVGRSPTRPSSLSPFSVYDPPLPNSDHQVQSFFFFDRKPQQRNAGRQKGLNTQDSRNEKKEVKRPRL
jgi:hypothetical protein